MKSMVEILKEGKCPQCGKFLEYKSWMYTFSYPDDKKCGFQITEEDYRRYLNLKG